MRSCLKQFFENKDVFNEFRASTSQRKAAKAATKALTEQLYGADAPELGSETSDNANDAGTNDEDTPVETLDITERVQAQLARDDQNATAQPGDKRPRTETVTLSKHDKQYLRQYERELTGDSVHYNLIKLHLLQHFIESIPMYGNITQYSTEAPETLHKPVKKGFKRAVNEKAQIANNQNRQYMLRMRELNIMYLARHGFNQKEAQQALNLYANKADRIAAARRNRLGLQESGVAFPKSAVLEQLSTRYSGPTDESGLSSNAMGDSNRMEACLTIGKEEPERDTEVPEHEVIAPLFDDTEARPGFQLRGKILDPSLHDIEGLKLRYCGEEDLLDEVLLQYLEETYRKRKQAFREATLTFETVNDLKMTAFSIAEISTIAFQSERDIEIQRAFCTGTKYVRGKQRNDFVFFADANEEFDNGDFGRFRVGRLRCLFTVRVPKPTVWVPHTSPSRYDTEMTDLHQMAYVEVLKYENHGLMYDHYEVGFCTPPTRASDRGVLIRLDQIDRIAHLIPANTFATRQDGTLLERTRYVVNNRASLYSFNESYYGLAPRE